MEPPTQPEQDGEERDAEGTEASLITSEASVTTEEATLERSSAIIVRENPLEAPSSGRRKKRSRRIVRAVETAAQRWKQNVGAGPSAPAYPPVFAEDPTLILGNVEDGVVRPLPRRKSPLKVTGEVDATPHRKKTIAYHANAFRVLLRLVRWIVTLGIFFTLSLWDRFQRRHDEKQDAIRLREAIEKMGGTGIKIGQQLSMRIDLLPYAYGVELSKMLDKVKPFPTEQAIEAIERATKRPLSESFSAFDPKPIGSASIACVFQAILKNGHKVAVKVRRPGIGPLFAADIRALSWALRFMEILTIFRPGFTRNFVFEFHSVLMEELDFTKEARYTELYRKRLRKLKVDYIDAPKIYFDYCSDEVLVTEFLSGIWVHEIIHAVEHKDQELLDYLAEHGIDPKHVARNLLRTNQLGLLENLVFHADPHPANILVRSNSQIVLIDFGSCGAYTKKEIYVWRQLVYAHAIEDIGHMVQCSLAIIEPLPPIDLDEFSKRLESKFWQDLYAFKSKHAEWYERTSANLWINLLELSREYEIPMNMNMLRMIRSSLLYETVAARIYKDIDQYKEHLDYNKEAGKRARKRLVRAIKKSVINGRLPDQAYIQVEQVWSWGRRLLYFVQRFLDDPPIRILQVVGKAIYAFINLFQLMFVFSIITGIPTIVLTVVRYGRMSQESPFKALRFAFVDVINNRVTIALLVIVAIINARRILFRFYDKDL